MARRTGETITLILAATGAAVLVLATLTLCAIEIRDPSTDTYPAWEIIGGIFSAIVGAATGYALGTRGRRDRSG